MTDEYDRLVARVDVLLYADEGTELVHYDRHPGADRGIKVRGGVLMPRIAFEFISDDREVYRDVSDVQALKEFSVEVVDYVECTIERA